MTLTSMSSRSSGTSHGGHDGELDLRNYGDKKQVVNLADGAYQPVPLVKHEKGQCH